MTELDKISEFAKRKNVTFRVKHETLERGGYKFDQTVFVFRRGSISIINVTLDTSEYELLLEDKKLAEQVIWELSFQLADIKAREEFDKDMEFLKTLKED